MTIRQRPHRVGIWVLLGAIAAAGSRSDAFTRIDAKVVSAMATVVSGTSTVTLSIETDPLPPAAFYGKNVEIPVKVINTSGGPLTPKDLALEIVYQLLDSAPTPNPIGTITRAPVALSRDAQNPAAVVGPAYIPMSDLVSIQSGGRISYYFRVLQSGSDTLLTKGGVSSVPAGTGANAIPADAFGVNIVSLWVGFVRPEGSDVIVPDLSRLDGNTTITFPPNAVSGAGTLEIRQENPAAWPAGPKGALPIYVYSMNLKGASLNHPAKLNLTYPASPTGKVVGTDYNGSDLAAYYFDGFSWRLLGRPNVDTTLHLVSVNTTQLGAFSLIPSGPVNAADIRPSQRIITPNNDGINDTADFTGIADNEDVNLFDIRGRRVRTLRGPDPKWDGKDDSGRTVEGGVYIYQYVSQGDRVSGVIAVAK